MATKSTSNVSKSRPKWSISRGHAKQTTKGRKILEENIRPIDMSNTHYSGIEEELGADPYEGEFMEQS